MNGRCYKCNSPLTTGDFDGMCNICRKQSQEVKPKKMSKELKALEVLGNTVIHHIDSCGNITNNKVSDSNEFKLIKKYLTPPTADEVCEALIDYFKKSKHHSYIDTAYYSEEGKYFYTEDENRSLVEIMFDNYYIHEIPPHLITLIGRFYEGAKNNEL